MLLRKSEKMSTTRPTRSVLLLAPALIFALTTCPFALASPAGNAPTMPSLGIVQNLTCELKKGDISCAKANVALMLKADPGFFCNKTYVDERFARNAKGRDPIPNAWEPVLEAVPGCNGLPDSWFLELSFMAILDKNWVDYYEKNRRFFAREGYRTLETSVRIFMDRVDYLYHKQFGIALCLSQIVPLPDLEDICKEVKEGESGYVDKNATETLDALRAAGKTVPLSDANVLRFGTNFPDCRSYVEPHSQLCAGTGLGVITEVPFTPDGRIKYDAPQTVAHEIAHFLGVCIDKKHGHCIGGHFRNEIPDIMVDNPWLYGRELPNGILFKFLTTCTPVYHDLLCLTTQKARCAKPIPPPSLAGRYVARSTEGKWMSGIF